ncbi:hypothetical protein GE061_018346 [Apolygus lucorum]|uniref:G-protein coupled receptors family 1 profile domain-containing protein n=1 Tax=Apolygus lucorum TaxID=248454 RepID=A0A8S9XDN8_APOLU|nr:hypothetical protein GE061_018346 [Apolygus lucorum]
MPLPGIIGVCWVLGSFLGFLPLLGWNRSQEIRSGCKFTKVMDYNFLVFLYLATIVFPALLMGAFYAHIYSVVLKQLRAILTVNGMASGDRSMLRVLGAARKRDVKATKILSIIVLFFVSCWFPLYTINFIQAFCPQCEFPELLMDSCIILSHLNSAGNPVLYAYHLKDFRNVLHAILTGEQTPLGSKPELSTVRLKSAAPNFTPKLPHKIYCTDDERVPENDKDYEILRARCSVDSNFTAELGAASERHGDPT